MTDTPLKQKLSKAENQIAHLEKLLAHLEKLLVMERHKSGELLKEILSVKNTNTRLRQAARAQSPIGFSHNCADAPAEFEQALASLVDDATPFRLFSPLSTKERLSDSTLEDLESVLPAKQSVMATS